MKDNTSFKRKRCSRSLIKKKKKMSGERSGKKGYMVMKGEGTNPKVALTF